MTHVAIKGRTDAKNSIIVKQEENLKDKCLNHIQLHQVRKDHWALIAGDLP